MFRKVILFSMLLLMMIPLAVQAQPGFGFANLPESRALIPLPYGSVAAPDPIGAIWTNPAGMGLGNTRGFIFTKPASFDQYSRIYGDDFGYAVAGPSIGFAAEYQNGDFLGRRYTLGLGGEVVQGIHLGFAYHWFRDLDRQNTWDAGLIVRPREWVSIGLVAQDLLGGRIGSVDYEPTYNIGLAFRPFGNRLTLSVDETLWRPLNGEYEFTNPRLLGEWQAVPGIALRGGYDMESETVFAGLSFTVESLQIGQWQGFRSDTPTDQVQDAGLGYIRLTSNAYRSVFNRHTPKRVVKMDLRGTLVEEEQGFSLFQARNRTLLETITRIERMREDERVTGIALRIDKFQAGLSDMTELRDALSRFRASGKKVVVYAYDFGMGSYYLASVADKVFLYPEGGIYLPGIGIMSPFFKGTLEKLDMEMQVVTAGKYKSAGESFTRTGFSDEARESIDAIIEDYWDTWVDAIAEGRHVSRETVITWVDSVMHSGPSLVENGMVDELLYPDEVGKRIKEEFEGTPKQLIIAENNYLESPLTEDEWVSMATPKIAIVYAVGAIDRGKNSRGFMAGKRMGSETIAEAIRQARADKNVKAIVLRVDSPGGSAIASDIIAREIRRTTDHSIEGVRHIPVIVSMSGVAASGGYYISAWADTIVADKTTITGSIGVVSSHLASEPGLDSLLGITFDEVSRGENIAFNSSRKLNENQLAIIEKNIDHTYATFKGIVSSGRDMELDRVEEVAQGRVWSGEDALELGLVDINGGLWDAIKVAKERVGVSKSKVIQADLYPKIFAEPIPTQIRSLLIGDELMSIQEMVRAKERLERLKGEGAMLILPIEEKSLLLK